MEWFNGLGYAPYGIIGILIFIGWVLNLVKLARNGKAEGTAMLVLRIFGIFIAPLGAVLGFFF